MDQIFSNGTKALSEEDIETIKSIAESNENLISEISVASTNKIQSANKKIKAIKNVKFLVALIIILPPKKAINNADRPIKLWAGKIKLGRANGSVGLDSLNVACPSTPRPKNK